MLDTITSRQNEKVKAAFALKKSPTEKAFLVEGFHLVQEAYEAGMLQEVFALIDPKFNVPTHLVTKEIIDKLALSSSPEGIVGVVSYSKKMENQGGRVLFLDRVQDPGNVGTLLRTAVSFGFFDVIASPGCASFFSPKVIASSQGAIFKARLQSVSDKVASLSSFQEKGYIVVASSLQDALPLESYEAPEKLVLVVGNEGQGISKEILDLADKKVRISMANMESLNVGVAGGILMHHFLKL